MTYESRPRSRTSDQFVSDLPSNMAADSIVTPFWLIKWIVYKAQQIHKSAQGVQPQKN